MIKKIVKSFEHVPPSLIRKKLKGVLWEGTPDSGLLALTFDDGPDPEITPLVLDTLDEIGARGTFFMVGERVQEYPAVARLVHERGHVIGNHSMTHCSMFLMPRDEVAREIDSTQKALSNTVGTEPELFRPPYGMFDFTTADAVRRRKLSMVLWTVLSGDYSDDPPEYIVKTVEPFIRPGAIMVFHDTVSGGGYELPGIIRQIGARASDRDIGFGSVDQLTIHSDVDDERAD